MPQDNWISTYKRMKLDPYFTAYTKINSRWIKDPNGRAKAIKLLDKNRGINLHDLGLGNGFVDIMPKVQQHKKK